MRKTLTALLMLFLCHVVSAQGRFGVKGGINLFSLHSENNQQQDYNNGKPGFLVGVSYELPMSNYFAFVPEVNYSYQSAEENYYGSKIHLGYVQVPILLHYYHQTSPVSLYAGPQANFITSAKVKPKTGDEQGIRSDVVQTDIGVTLGVAYTPIAWKKGITVDVRAYRGFMNVIKAEYDNGTKSRATLFMLTVGYAFGK